MNFWRKYASNPSKGEERLYLVCTRHNLHPLTNERVCLMWTFPDQLYPMTPFRQMLPFYLDGIEVHSSQRAELRDERINTLLTKCRTPPLRIRYHPPLSKRRAEQCYKIIKETLELKLTKPRLEEV